MTRSHALSALAGFVLALVVFVSMGQTAVDRTAYVRVQYMPHPRDMVQVHEGAPYTVPQGKLFVLTALGVTNTGVSGIYPVAVQVDGQNYAVSATIMLNTNAVEGLCSMATVPPGLTIPAGSVIEVLIPGGPDQRSRAWGYLADA